MNLRYKLAILAFVVTAIGGIIWCAGHYHDKWLAEKTRADAAEQRVDSSEAITANILHTVNVINQITEANQHAKEQISLESSRASHDIKVAVSDDDCANRPVPVGAANRLRQYADSLRTSSGGTAASKPDY
ncbi:TPA: DUF2570 domain-containing protein [Kluyvera ascorbata]